MNTSSWKRSCILLAMAFIWHASGCGSNENSSKTAAEVLKITAEEYARDWHKDRAAFKEKYREKVLEVEGSVERIALQGTSPWVFLRSGNPGESVPLHFYGAQREGIK